MSMGRWFVGICGYIAVENEQLRSFISAVCWFDPRKSLAKYVVGVLFRFTGSGAMSSNASHVPFLILYKRREVAPVIGTRTNSIFELYEGESEFARA